MKHSKMLVALVAAFGFIGVAAAADDFTVSGGAHTSSDFNFRGQTLTGESPTMGAGATVGHTSGAFAALGLDTVNLTGATGGEKQLLTSLTVGYGTSVGDVKLAGGVSRYNFSGANSVHDLSFSEAFVSANWNGVSAAVYRNVNGAVGNPSRLGNGDVYGSLGYTYTFGKASVGADVGYYWYDAPTAKNGVAATTLHAGYQVGQALSLGVAYQVDGDDAAGADQERNNTGRVSLAFSF